MQQTAVLDEFGLSETLAGAGNIMPNTITRRTALILIGTAGLGGPGATGAWIAPASGSAVYTDIIRGTGAGGFDVVAYVNAGRPVQGSAQITHVWNGGIWRFASAAKPGCVCCGTGALRAGLWRALRLGGSSGLQGQGRPQALEDRRWPPVPER